MWLANKVALRPLLAAIALLIVGTACISDGSSGLDREALLMAEHVDPQAPESFQVVFETTKGEFVVEVVRDWAPRGADRFYFLASNGYYDDTAFFRAIDDFMVQFGIHGDPELNRVWRDRRIDDDPVNMSNERGLLSFASAGPDTRTTQLFINLVDNERLDPMGFTPFGRVVEGMDVVDSLYTDYGEGPPVGSGPEQQRIMDEGNQYLSDGFPALDFVITARVKE